MGRLGFKLPEHTVEHTIQTFSEVYDWGLRDLNIPEIHKQTLGQGIKVAIVDSGKSEHFETKDATAGARNFSKSPHLVDKNGHSSFCAGIIAAKKNDEGIIGVAPEAKLYFAKAMDDAGSGDPSALVKAINWSIQQKVDIISISAGMFFDFKPLRKIIQKAHRKNIIVVAAVGNCLAKGTRIKTSDGWKNIEDIQVGEKVYSFSPDERTLQLQEVKNTFSRSDTVYRLKTFTRSIQATQNHKFLCATSKNESNFTAQVNISNETFLAGKTAKDQYFYEWKELQNINSGDFILIDKNSDLGLEDKNVDEDKLYLYGVMLGDGWITIKENRHRFGISTPINSPHTDYLLELSSKVLGKNMASSKFELNLYSHSVTREWGALFPGLLNKNSHTKRVEPWVFNLPISKKLSVIQGYLDADGCINNGNIVFECANKNLLEDVYELCIRSGVKTTNIFDRTRETNFGFIHSWGFKITNFNDIHAVSSRHPYKYAKLKKEQCSEGERDYSYKINKIIEQNNVVFDRVQSIEEIGEDAVFDLEMPGLSNFVANNIVVHNSGTRQYDVAFPARYPEVIGVAAYDKRHKVARFSSRGANVSFAMPGVGIYSTYLNNQFCKMNGTSFSAPIMTGICALILSKHRQSPDDTTPCETPKQMMEHLKKYSKKLNGQKETGFGNIDLEEAFSD